MRTRQRLPVTLAVIAAAVLISACGGSSGATDTVSGGGSGSGSGNGSGGGSAVTAKVAKGEQFARCMRRNGVSAFPDPPASGSFTIDAIANGSSVNTNSPAFTQALTACKALEPAGFTGNKRSTAQQSAALRFARCVRRHGVPDFPDPTPNAPLIDTNLIPSANEPGGMSALHAATQACSSLAAVAIGRQP